MKSVAKLTAPWFENERISWELLGKAWGRFAALEQTHPSDLEAFCNAIHTCQQILGQRILRRQYPLSFATYKPKKE